MTLHLDTTEVSRHIDLFARRRFLTSRTLSATVHTQTERLAAVVPRPLEVNGSAMRVVVGRWDDEVVGVHTGGAVYIPVKFGHVTGEFMLRMYVDSDLSLVVGREIFGEPKLLADTAELVHDAEVTRGVAERGATRIALSGEMRPAEPAGPATRRSFTLKAPMTSDATSVYPFASLLVTEWRGDGDVRIARGLGRVELAGALGHDQLPRRWTEPTRLTWTEGSAIGRTSVLATVDGDAALPTALARLGLTD